MFRPMFCLLGPLFCAAGLVAQEGASGSVRLDLREFSIELRATWEQLTDTVYKFEEKYPLVRDLEPEAETSTYSAPAFRGLLPSTGVAVGDTWRVDVENVLPFLRQLHNGATAELHHDNGFGLGAHGGWGCLRALSEAFAEVRLRVHADFLLAGDGGAGSSWFTPAQFAGRMVIDRQRGVVVAFELGVPSQSANVDVNIATGHGVSADIGRIPRMDLVGGKSPASFGPGGAEISESMAETALARRFYPFAELAWLDLDAALAESRATGKPMHVMALFGSLLDESC